MAFSASWQLAPADGGGRLRAFRAARRHSRIVRILRVALPLAGFAAVAGFVVVARLALPGNLDLGAAQLSVTKNSIIMDRPHLTGFDRHHREYSLSASRAIQPLTNPMAVRLEDLQATVESAAGASTTIKAEAGDYDHNKNTLKLLGPITIDSSEGYLLRMTDADVNFTAGTLASSNDVTIGYGGSHITGKSLAVSDGGKVIVVEGDVRTTVVPPKSASTLKSAPTAPVE